MVSVEVVRIVGIPSLDVEVVVDIFDRPADEDVDEVTWLVSEAWPELFVVFDSDCVDSVVVAETVDEDDLEVVLASDFAEVVDFEDVVDFVDFVVVDFSVSLSSRATR